MVLSLHTHAAFNNTANATVAIVILITVLCCCLVTQLCLTLCYPMDCSLPGFCPWAFPGKNTGILGCHFLLQGIFLTQESNPCLLHWQVDSLPLSQLGSPIILIHGFIYIKCCTQYASKFGKLNSGHRTGKGQFSFQSQRKAMPKNAQTTAQLHSSHMLVK